MVPEQFAALGKFLAKMQLAGKSDVNQFNVKTFKILNTENFPQFIEDVQKVLGEKVELSKYDEIAKQHIELQKKLSIELGYGTYSLDLPNDHLLHGDFHEFNVFYNEANQITAIFDFEKIEYAPRASELIRATEFVCFHGGFDEEAYKAAETFLKAYNEVYPIPKEEFRKAIRFSYLGRVYSTWILGEMYLKNNARPQEYLQEAHNNLKYFSEHLDEFESRLLSYLD